MTAHKLSAVIGLAIAACGCAAGPVAPPSPPTDQARLFFIGQDLDALRGYFASECCVTPDGTTAYLSLYRLLDGEDFGGLGVDPRGVLLKPEASWGAGSVGARQSADEFDVPHLALGLHISENDAPDGLSRIAAGDFDAEIERLATFIESVEGDVYLRIGYEFDGVWNSGQEDTGAFIAAWRRIVDVIRAHEVSNVRFVWQAGASTIDDAIEGKREDIRAWYPGDEYVDWMALSWFMEPDAERGAEGYRTATPQELADEVVDFARAQAKPVLIAEAAPQGFDLKDRFRANISPIWDGPAGEGRISLSDQDIWDSWYQPMFDYMAERGDVIRALAYINVDWDSQPMWGPPYSNGFWGDTRLETNPYITRRFNAALEEWRATPKASNEDAGS